MAYHADACVYAHSAFLYLLLWQYCPLLLDHVHAGWLVFQAVFAFFSRRNITRVQSGLQSGERADHGSTWPISSRNIVCCALWAVCFSSENRLTIMYQGNNIRLHDFVRIYYKFISTCQFLINYYWSIFVCLPVCFQRQQNIFHVCVTYACACSGTPNGRGVTLFY